MSLLRDSPATFRNLALRAAEPTRALLLAFSTATLGTIQFIRHSLPWDEALHVAAIYVLFLILIIVGGLTVILFALDRVIAHGLKSEKALRIFRTTLFVATFVLVFRQLQLYFDPVRESFNSIDSIHRILAAAVALAALGVVIWLCIRAHRGVALFFFYMAPVSLLLLAILPFQIAPRGLLPDRYAAEVAPPPGAQLRPPVFIVIFDEMSYDVLLRDGELDAENFPNFAALAEDGVWFTNATANYLHTRFAVPALVEAIRPLSDSFAVRLHLQFDNVERIYRPECGVVFTCRGLRQLSEEHPDVLVANLALRTLFEAAPRPVEQALQTPLGKLVDALDSSYPSADVAGLHIFSKEHFASFLEDIDERARGQIFVFHTNVPHTPYVFDERGTALGPWDRHSNAPYENYRRQAGFADLLLGDFVDRLKQQGLYDEAIIVVTSDHGRRFEVPHNDSDSIELDLRTPHVPLLIRAPGIDAHVSDVDYQHFDFGATLLDVLGMPPLEESSGVSAFDPLRPIREKVFFVDYGDRAYWTYVYDQDDKAWQVSAFVEEALTRNPAPAGRR